MKTFLLDVLADIWWQVKNWWLIMAITLPPVLLVAWIRQPYPVNEDPWAWVAAVPGMIYGLVRSWKYLSITRPLKRHGSYDFPCKGCGVKLHGEGLPSVNWRNGAAYSYCPDCGTSQHHDFRSAV